MKHTTLSRTLLGLALMGALAAAPPMTSVARADAPDVAALNGDRDFGRDDNDGDRTDRGPRRDRGGRRGDADGRGKAGRADFGGRGRDNKGPRGGRADMNRRGDRADRADFEGRDKGRGRADFGGRGDNTLGRGGANRPAVRPAIAPQFTGVVNKVKSDSEFDVRIGDKTYNVYLSAPQRRVSVGQTVGLNGERIGTNDIRSAILLQPRRR